MLWFIQRDAKTYDWLSQQIKKENQCNQLFALV